MRHLAVLLCAILVACPLFAGNWSDCSGDLDRIGRTARDLKDLSDQLSSLASDVESAESEAESCDEDDDCEDVREHFRDRKRELQSLISQMVSEADDLADRARRVQRDCGGTSGVGLCGIYRSYVGDLSADALMKLCKEAMSDGQALEADEARCWAAMGQVPDSRITKSLVGDVALSSASSFSTVGTASPRS